jgi:uncharacterized protein with NAD-binding domain and iron-sulfur cluster
MTAPTPTATEPKKTRVAVLGGGIGAMTAAYALTSTPERRARYDVTVHQLGWRIGGKAASGRNPEAGERIEQHGLHLWMGFYENAFRMLRACYEELGRPAGAPLATWDQAFKPQSYAVVFCKLSDESAANDGWFPWTLDFPTNGRVPGDGGALPSPWQLFRLGVEWLWSLWQTSDEARSFRAQPPVHAAAGIEDDVPAWILAALRKVEALPRFAPLDPPLVGAGIAGDDAPHVTPEPDLGRLIAWIRNVVRAMPEAPAQHDAGSQHILTWLVRKLMDLAWARLHPYVASEPWAYKLWVTINLAGSMAVGFLGDGILFHGWGSIDHLDFRAWLKSHGASDVTLGSGPLQAIYDLVFAFVNGDPEKGNLAAGTAMSGLLRMLLTYKGAIFYETAAGLGDSVLAPLYEVLSKRGVKFDFFHRVAALHLSPDRKLVGAIEVIEQVRLKGPYEPLVTVKGLPCWPNAPRHDQIEDGDELRASGLDLESPYSPPWKDARPVTLRLGEDFDAVVLGISLGAIPYIAAELIRESPPFASMVANVGTVQTLAFQLWLDRDLAELGWQTPSGTGERPVSIAHVEPLDTWADMTHLVPREDWQSPALPRNLSYFCGPLEQLGPTPPFTDHGFPARQKARVQSIARKYLENDVGRLWPLATKSGGHGFRCDYVISQYYRANIDPSERYVLSVAGSTHYRLAPGQSGFGNLVLAGDWVRTSLNAGCVEAAVEGGLYAAEALLQEPLDVFARELPPS